MANKERPGQSVPDSDIEGYKKSYKEGGFTDEEIDIALMRTNAKYREARLAELVEEKLHALEKIIHEKFPPAERESKKAILEAKIKRELGI